MANFNLVIDTSNFKPFSYKDIMAPYDDYAKDYDIRRAEIDKYIDTYGNLMLPLGSKVNDEYLKYLTLQNAALDSFYKYGLNADTGAALTKAFNMNKGTVKRMLDAAKTYQDYLAKKQEYENNGYIVSGLNNDAKDIDAIYTGKKPLLTAIKQKDVIDTATQMFSKMNENLLNKAKLRVESIIKNLYLKLIADGLDETEAYQLAKGSLGELAKDDSYLADAMRTVMESLPGYEKLDKSAKNKVYKSLGIALLSSVTGKSQIVDDKTLDNQLKVDENNMAHTRLTLALNDDRRSQEAADRASEEYKATYTFDDNGHITGYNPAFVKPGRSGGSSGSGPATITTTGADNLNHQYGIQFSGGKKIVYRLEPDGSKTIIASDHPTAKKVRKLITGSESIESNPDDDDDLEVGSTASDDIPEDASSNGPKKRTIQ